MTCALVPPLAFLLGLVVATAAAADTVACPSSPSSASQRHEPATSVWNLKPSQVDVVLALGDSISAGFGMEGKRGGLHEYRGKSWSIGGDANATTLPNYLRQFSPNVTGYSVGRREVRERRWSRGRLCDLPLSQ